MINRELSIHHISGTLAPHQEQELGGLIENAYNPAFTGRLNAQQLDTALRGVRYADHILVGKEAEKPTSVLGVSVYTRENNPEFYAEIAKRILALKDRGLQSQTAAIMNQIDGLMYTHEMISLPERRGKGDIAALREQALKEAGFDLKRDRVALFGEFQGLDSIGVQRGLPNSVSMLAGVHIPLKNRDTKLDEKETAAFKALTQIVGETFLSHYHPDTVVHENGVVESEVFDTPPRRSKDTSHPKEIEATQVIEDLQKRLEGKGFASAIGATYVNILTTS